MSNITDLVANLPAIIAAAGAGTLAFFSLAVIVAGYLALQLFNHSDPPKLRLLVLIIMLTAFGLVPILAKPKSDPPQEEGDTKSISDENSAIAFVNAENARLPIARYTYSGQFRTGQLTFEGISYIGDASMVEGKSKQWDFVLSSRFVSFVPVDDTADIFGSALTELSQALFCGDRHLKSSLTDDTSFTVSITVQGDKVPAHRVYVDMACDKAAILERAFNP